MGYYMPQDRIKKYENKRNWVEYNERLVRRGELYLSLNFVKNWDRELDRMNKNKKRGRPYEYPEQFIQFMAFVHILYYLPYRQMEGFIRKLSELIQPLKAADYTTMFKRISLMDIPLQETIREKQNEDDNVVIAVDSSGIKVTNRGEWIREKWKVHRGWIKVHIAVDVKTKEVVAIEVTNETVTDAEKFKDLIQQSEKNAGKNNIKRVLADGAYDTKEDFNLLSEKNVESGIKTRKNARTRARGSSYRGMCVRERRRLGYDEWKEKYGYGYRWSSEAVFSSVKRINGESVRASSTWGMFREVKMKFIFYNMLLNFA